MRSPVLYKLFLFALLQCQFGCNGPLPKEPTPIMEVVNYRGEQVLIPHSFPKELFDQTISEFASYYDQALAKKGLRINENLKISLEIIGDIIKRNSVKYPVIDSNQEISEEALERVFKDFRSITTKEQALQKISIVYDYYDTLLKWDVLREVMDFESSKIGRVESGSSGYVSVPEKNVLLANPGYAQHYINASNDAKNLVIMGYGNDTDGNKGNAFKHSVWTCLSIRYVLKGSPASEESAINFTQNATSAHEKGDDGALKKTISEAMDLHNNMSARVWMESEVKWGIGPLRKMPDMEKIVNTMWERANVAAFNGSVGMILSSHGGENDITWNNLYNNLYGPFQHLVYTLP